MESELGRAGSIRDQGGTFRSGQIGKEPFGCSPFPALPSSSDLASSAALPALAAASLAGPSSADRLLRLSYYLRAAEDSVVEERTSAGRNNTDSSG